MKVSSPNGFQLMKQRVNLHAPLEKFLELVRNMKVLENFYKNEKNIFWSNL